MGEHGSAKFDTEDVLVLHRSPDVFLAEWKGRRIGSLMLAGPSRREPNARWVFNVFVEPGLRRRGVATKLYDRAEEFLKQSGHYLIPSETQYEESEPFWRGGEHPRIRKGGTRRFG